jgi:cytoskeletal protein CcmA (bactofilin family)
MSIFSSNKEKENNPNPGYVPPSSAPTSPIQSTTTNSNTGSSYASNQSSSITTISEGAIVDGQIKIEGDIRIDGLIKGSVTSKGKVLMSKSGKVDGDIICQNAEISGHVSGKLKVADVLMLKGNALVDGDINTGKLVIESGVKFNGNCSMGAGAQQSTPNTASAATPTPPKTGNSVELNAK